MSLTSSLFSGISGLNTLGNSMQIIGDNIANVNTIGFKSSGFVFADLLSQSVATQSGSSQVGRGTALNDVASNFGQGSFESTGNATDLGIGGDGFFVLRESSSERLFYTRAGNFSFDEDGFLTTPGGYVVQGWGLDENGDDVGAVTDISLSSFTSAPEPTDRISIVSNLDSDSVSNTAAPMSNAWDALNTPPIDPTRYEYQTSVKVYDSLGSSHDVTVYYDKVSDSNWEYIVSCNPDEDRRSFITGPTDSQAGLLARGVIRFDEGSGRITPTGLNLETLTGSTASLQEITNLSVGAGNTGLTAATDVSTQIDNPIDMTANDTITCTYNAGAWTATGAAYPNLSVVSSGANSIVLNLDNTANTVSDITVTIASTATPSAGPPADTIAFDITGSNDWAAAAPNTSGYLEFSSDFIGGVAGSTVQSIEFDIGAQFDGASWASKSLTTTQYARSSTTVFQSANGYSAGDLQGVEVDIDGIITGLYSNGQVTALNRVSLAKFLNEGGLYKEGGSLYRETRDSGDAITNHPGTNGLGNISPNSLEQSNVDIANEFVKMITSQRGFQANSKIITTVDQMLGETINMKR